EKVHDPEPPKDPVKQEDSLEPARKPKKPKIEISTTPVVRNSNKQNSTSKQPSDADDKARQLADARQHNVDLLKNAARSLRQDFSPSTEVEMPAGGFGEAVASYAQVGK